MFNIEKMIENNFPKIEIEICKELNENEELEKSCKLHDFELIKKGRGCICKNCGCKKPVEFVTGYKRGLEHGRRDG